MGLPTLLLKRLSSQQSFYARGNRKSVTERPPRIGEFVIHLCAYVLWTLPSIDLDRLQWHCHALVIPWQYTLIKTIGAGWLSGSRDFRVASTATGSHSFPVKSRIPPSLGSVLANIRHLDSAFALVALERHLLDYIPKFPSGAPNVVLVCHILAFQTRLPHRYAISTVDLHGTLNERC